MWKKLYFTYLLMLREHNMPYPTKVWSVYITSTRSENGLELTSQMKS